ncbi:MAG: hypothetical protein G5701_02990 [Serratia symbiotica]|nr:hypothetical protein [Serratia symbiotica]
MREGCLLGIKRIPQRNLGIQRFTYDQGLAQLYGTPPNTVHRQAGRPRHAASARSA